MSNARRVKRRTAAAPVRIPPSGPAGAAVAPAPVTIGMILGVRHRIDEMNGRVGDYGMRGVTSRAEVRESAVGVAAGHVYGLRIQRAVVVSCWLAGGWAEGQQEDQ